MPPTLLQAVVFSEGRLHLDNCDFSNCTSAVLVYSEPNSTAEMRNIVLGDKNCEPRRQWASASGARFHVSVTREIEVARLG